MDDAVAGGHVGLDHLGVVHGDGSGGDFHVERLAVHGLGLHRLDVCGHDFARHDVVGEDGNELFLVLRLKQVFHRAFGELGEGFVGRREDGERAGALEGLDEAGGFYRGNQGVEAAVAGGDGDDVFARGLGFSVSNAQEAGRGDDCGEGEDTDGFHGSYGMFCFLSWCEPGRPPQSESAWQTGIG